MNIQKKIDYTGEGIALLARLGSGESFSAASERWAKLYTETPAAFLKENRKRIAVLTRIEKRARREFQEDMEEVAWYFAPADPEENQDFPGSIGLLWDEFSPPKDLEPEDFSERLLSMEKEEYYKAFGKAVQGFGDSIRNSSYLEKLEDPMDIIRYIMKMDAGKEVKWKLQELLVNRKEHQEKMLSLLSRAVAVLKSGNEPEELMGAFVAQWEERTGKTGFGEYLETEGQLPGILKPNPLGYRIYPKLLSPMLSGIGVSIDGTGEYDQPFIITLGIFRGNGCPPIQELPGKKERSQEFYLEVMKMMADKSKFEILSYIKDGKAYGNELAGHLGLTTATVSHHMSMLLKCGLVEPEQEGTKFYYTPNKELLRECLEYYRKRLL